jgi:hypothetical protein
MRKEISPSIKGSLFIAIIFYFFYLTVYVCDAADGQAVLLNMHYERGVMLYKMGKYEIAIQELQRALEIDPTYAKARKYLTVVIKNKNKMIIDQLYSEAEAYYKIKDYQKAQDAYNKILEVVPNDGYSLYNLEMVRHKIEKLDKIKQEELHNRDRIRTKELEKFSKEKERVDRSSKKQTAAVTGSKARESSRENRIKSELNRLEGPAEKQEKEVRYKQAASIAAGNGLKGGGSSGEIAVDTTVVATKDNSLSMSNKTLASPAITNLPTASGATWVDLGTVNAVNIKGGTIDGVTVGSSKAGTGKFTNLQASQIQANKLQAVDVSTCISKDENNNMTFTDAVVGTKTLAQLVAAKETRPSSGSIGKFTDLQADQLKVGDSLTRISKDKSDNMTFTDAVVGTKTLAQLVADKETWLSSVRAGNGLIGGGALGDVKIDVGAGKGISVSSDGVAVDTTVVATADNLLTMSNKTLTSSTILSPIIANAPTAVGATWVDLGDVNTIKIKGGSIDGVVIGGSSPAAGTFDTATANKVVTSKVESLGDATIDLASKSKDTKLTIINSDAARKASVDIENTLVVNGTNAAGESLDALSLTGSLNSMDGSDIFRGFYIGYTNATHKGRDNYVLGIHIDELKGDNHTTELALLIESGWDYQLALRESSGNKITAFRTGDQEDNIIYTLPTKNGNSGDVLTTDGRGNLGWSGKTFTGPHYYFKASSDLETGELVKLDNDMQIVRSMQEKDPAAIGIYWGVPRDQDSLLRPGAAFSVACEGDSYEENGRYALKGAWVCSEGGEIKKGDLLCSANRPGYLKKQDDQIVRNYTVAKALADIKFDEDRTNKSAYVYFMQ